MILADTSGLLALLDRGEREHRRIVRAVPDPSESLVVIDFVLAEVDYLVLRRLGRDAERRFIAQLLEGVFLREPVSDADLRRALQIADQFRDKATGPTDASLIAVAERPGTRTVLTLDRRHFAGFRDRKGRALELLPP